ncbi:MAG: DMT family transporter [Pseudomonadales bacterium]
MRRLFQQPSLPTRAYIFLTITSFLFACNHVIGRGVSETIPPIGLSFWRWFAATMILLPFVFRRIKQSATICHNSASIMIQLSVFMIGATTLILVALNFTTAINVSLINSVQPTVTMLFACIFAGEILTARRSLGIICGIVGVVVMIAKADWQVLAELDFTSGDFIAMLAMCGFSLYAINIRKIPLALNTSEKLFWVAFIGSIFLLPFYIAESILYKTVPLNVTTITVVMTLALLISIIGNALWNAGNFIVGPSKAAAFINLIPVFGAVLAISFLGEHVYLYHFIGAGLVFVALRLVVGGNKQTTKKL